MPCPHYARDQDDCRLLDDPPEGEEEAGAPVREELISRTWCLSPGTEYRGCPIFQRFLADLAP